MPPIRPKRSPLWVHYKQGDNEAICNYCSTKLSTKNGSLGTLKRHMTTKHPTISLCVERQPNNIENNMPTENNIPSQPSAQTITAIASTSSCTPMADMRISQSSNLITNYIRKPLSARKVDQIDRQVVAMVTKGHHSFRLVEEPEFKKFVDMVSTCPGYQLPTRKTLSNTLIPKYYTEVFEKVFQYLKESFAICLCTDAWTSSANENYIAVTAHFINANTEMQSFLLGCINYSERHTSENLVAFLRQIMQDWQITNKITCVVSDNAANIQAAIRLGEWRPVGCFAHTLNLIVQNGLKLISDIVGKVKSIVEYFKKSCSAQTKLESVLKQMSLPILKLKQECPTRWNSCYEMLERILKVKDAVISTLALTKNELNLQVADWEVIETVVAILKPFFEVTEEVSSENHVTLSKVLVFTQIMSKHIVKSLEKNYKHPVIPELLKKFKMQIETRLFDLESNILYADATILDPRFKQKGFRTRQSYEKAVEDIRRRISRIRINSTVGESQACVESQAPVDTNSMWADFDAEMKQVVRPENSVVAGIRELDKYLNEEYLHRKEDPLKWWHTRRHIYPHIYQLVLKRLCIQATSVSCERIFSGAGQVITNRRKLLKPSKVSQVVFLHNNM